MNGPCRVPAVSADRDTHMGRAQARQGGPALTTDRVRAVLTNVTHDVFTHGQVDQWLAEPVTFTEWSVANPPITVTPDGTEWAVVLTGDGGRDVEIPAALIEDLHRALGRLEPPQCRRCGKWADPSRDDDLCVDHGPTGRWP